MLAARELPRSACSDATATWTSPWRKSCSSAVASRHSSSSSSCASKYAPERISSRPVPTPRHDYRRPRAVVARGLATILRAEVDLFFRQARGTSPVALVRHDGPRGQPDLVIATSRASIRRRSRRVAGHPDHGLHEPYRPLGLSGAHSRFDQVVVKLALAERAAGDRGRTHRRDRGESGRLTALVGPDRRDVHHRRALYRHERPLVRRRLPGRLHPRVRANPDHRPGGVHRLRGMRIGVSGGGDLSRGRAPGQVDRLVEIVARFWTRRRSTRSRTRTRPSTTSRTSRWSRGEACLALASVRRQRYAQGRGSPGSGDDAIFVTRKRSSPSSTSAPTAGGSPSAPQRVARGRPAEEEVRAAAVLVHADHDAR